MKLFKPLFCTVTSVAFFALATHAHAATSHTFPAFSVGTLKGGGVAFTKSFNVSGLAGTQYLFARITADYASGPQPHDAYPSTMNMELSNGGTNVFWPASPPTIGAVNHDYTNAIVWYGLFPGKAYPGGTNLVIKFQDTYSDTNGPYYSTITNVVVTLYPATSPAKTFTSFDVGTLKGGGVAFTKSFNVSGLAGTQYLFARITADYASGPQPHDAYPSTMNMELSDGGTNIFWPASPPAIGAVNKDYTNAIVWYGLFPGKTYPGGTNLVIKFQDTYNDTNGPYYSTITNVVATLYPATSPAKTFTSFDVGTLKGGGVAFTKSFNVSGLAGTQYLFARITADYASAPQPHDAYPSTMNMELSNGGTNVFWPASPPTIGAVNHDYTNAIAWYGLFPGKAYPGGTNLVIKFQDTYNDTNGPYYSTITNVVVTLYPAVTAAVTAPQLAISHSGDNIILAWTNSAAGFSLESTTNLMPPVIWHAVSPPPVMVDARFMVTNAISRSAEFYRLSQ